MPNARIPLTLTTTPRTATDTTHDSLVQNMMNEQSKTGAKFARKRPSLSLHVEASTNNSHVAGLFYDAPRDRFVYVDEGFRLSEVRKTPIALWSPVVTYPPGSDLDRPSVSTPTGSTGKPPSNPVWVTKPHKLILGGVLTKSPTPHPNAASFRFVGYSEIPVFADITVFNPPGYCTLGMDIETVSSSSLIGSIAFEDINASTFGFSLYRDSFDLYYRPRDMAPPIYYVSGDRDSNTGLWTLKDSTDSVILDNVPDGSSIKVFKNINTGNLLIKINDDILMDNITSPPAYVFTYQLNECKGFVSQILEGVPPYTCPELWIPSHLSTVTHSRHDVDYGCMVSPTWGY